VHVQYKRIFPSPETSEYSGSTNWIIPKEDHKLINKVSEQPGKLKSFFFASEGANSYFNEYETCTVLYIYPFLPINPNVE
jgi:hypothetical protein